MIVKIVDLWPVANRFINNVKTAAVSICIKMERETINFIFWSLRWQSFAHITYKLVFIEFETNNTPVKKQ